MRCIRFFIPGCFQKVMLFVLPAFSLHLTSLYAFLSASHTRTARVREIYMLSVIYGQKRVPEYYMVKAIFGDQRASGTHKYFEVISKKCILTTCTYNRTSRPYIVRKVFSYFLHFHYLHIHRKRSRNAISFIAVGSFSHKFD